MRFSAIAQWAVGAEWGVEKETWPKRGAGGESRGAIEAKVKAQQSE